MCFFKHRLPHFREYYAFKVFKVQLWSLFDGSYFYLLPSCCKDECCGIFLMNLQESRKGGKRGSRSQSFMSEIKFTLNFNQERKSVLSLKHPSVLWIKISVLICGESLTFWDACSRGGSQIPMCSRRKQLKDTFSISVLIYVAWTTVLGLTRNNFRK